MRAFTSSLTRLPARTVIPRSAAALASSRSMLITPSPTLRLYARGYAAKAEPTEEDAKKDEDANLTEEQKQIKDLQSKLEAKNSETIELKDRLLRAVADFRNLQEVTKKDVRNAKDFALQKFAKDLLESVDNFGHALSAFKQEDLKKSKEISDLYTGVEMTKNVFENTLRKHGIQKLDPIGEPFNPNKHEATFELAQKDKEPGTVFHVQQLGYTLNDRVIRPAKVGIVKAEDK